MLINFKIHADKSLKNIGLSAFSLLDSNKKRIKLEKSNLVKHDFSNNIDDKEIVNWLNNKELNINIPFKANSYEAEFTIDTLSSEKVFFVELTNWINSSALVKTVEIFTSESIESPLDKIQEIDLDTEINSKKTVRIFLDKTRFIFKNPITKVHYSILNDELYELKDTSENTLKIFGMKKSGIDLTQPLKFIHKTTKKEKIALKTPQETSAYHYISDTPNLLIFSESEKLLVESDVEAYDFYDAMPDTIKIITPIHLLNKEVESLKMVVNANWTPLDSLEGDFEVFCPCSEIIGNSIIYKQKSTPVSKIAKMSESLNLFGELEKIRVANLSDEYSYRNESRFLLTSSTSKDWFTWSETDNKFLKIPIPTEENVLKKGMTNNQLENLTKKEWEEWEFSDVIIGVLLKNNKRDTIKSVIENIEVTENLPISPSSVNDINFNIINTKPTLNLKFEGNVLQGNAEDEDSTNIQYSVLLNGKKIFPANTDWTKPLAPPFDIAVGLDINDIHLGVENTLKIIFRDAWGTEESWTTKFIGERSGLMFYDVTGELYSTEIGEVLKYLDFGVITAGQTTIEHEIIIKNQYAYDVTDLKVWIETPKDNPFPDGMEAQISKTLSPFINEPILKYDSVMKIGEEKSLYVRLSTTLGATPNAAGSFDIKVKAKKVE